MAGGSRPSFPEERQLHCPRSAPRPDFRRSLRFPYAGLRHGRCARGRRPSGPTARSSPTSTLLLRAEIRLNGAPARGGQIRRFERYDVVEIPGPAASRLALAVDGCRAEVAVSPLERGTFAALNCLFTLSRNNDLRWIRNWVRFHVREHGAEAVLLFDNSSTA